jgi:hypothetical protein
MSTTTGTAAVTAFEKPLLSPFRKGDRVIIPKGTRSHYRGQTVTSRARQTVTITHAGDGYLERGSTLVEGETRMRLFAVRPYITWAGAGGYWRDVKLTDEIFEANGVTAEVNEVNMKAWRYDVPAE